MTLPHDPRNAQLEANKLRKRLRREVGGCDRHTSTDFGQNDARMTGYEDCRLQRNLTDQGREDARAISRAISALRIPIGDVLSSPFCRTMETGRLMFGRATATVAVRDGPATNEG